MKSSVRNAPDIAWLDAARYSTALPTSLHRIHLNDCRRMRHPGEDDRNRRGGRAGPGPYGAHKRAQGPSCPCVAWSTIAGLGVTAGAREEWSRCCFGQCTATSSSLVEGTELSTCLVRGGSGPRSWRSRSPRRRSRCLLRPLNRPSRLTEGPSLRAVWGCRSSSAD